MAHSQSNLPHKVVVRKNNGANRVPMLLAERTEMQKIIKPQPSHCLHILQSFCPITLLSNFNLQSSFAPHPSTCARPNLCRPIFLHCKFHTSINTHPHLFPLQAYHALPHITPYIKRHIYCWKLQPPHLLASHSLVLVQFPIPVPIKTLQPI